MTKKKKAVAPVSAPQAEAPAPPSMWRKVRENAEAVIIAIILALIIRHYSLEAFEIPTGSMAPGLYGVHINADCPNCQTVDAVGLQIDQFTNQLRLSLTRGYIYEGPCPECGLEILQGVTRHDSQVHCARCEADRRGTPEHYREVPAFARVEVQCSECTYHYTHYFEPKESVSGHKILVNKFSYEAGDPERWQVIVFKFNRQRNYIKRLVGLPGETILVVDGDIHINGEIERKPLHVQEDIWFQVHDTDIPEIGLMGNAWREKGGFTPMEEGTSLRFNALDGVAQLRYVRPVRNIYSYNGTRDNHNRTEPVRDLRALLDLKVNGVDAAGSPRVWVDVRNDDIVYRLALPIGGGTGEVLRVPAELANETHLTEETREVVGTSTRGWSVFATLPEGTKIDKSRTHEIDFSLVDRQVRVILDGNLLLEEPIEARDYSSGASSEGRRTDDADISPTGNDVTLRVRHCGGQVDRIRLFRDIHYTRHGEYYRHAVNFAYQIGEDGYFAMGDNSPSSLDSRAWGALRHQNLLGRGFAIFWPALPWRFEVGFIR